jgi:serine/threonine protein kinase
MRTESAHGPDDPSPVTEQGTVLQEPTKPLEAATEEAVTPPEPQATQDFDAAAEAEARARSARQPKVAGYTIVQKIGEGAFGSVWLAEASALQVRKAIKFFKARQSYSSQWQQVTAEVRTLAQLMDDPGVVHIEDADLKAEPPYFIMSFAEGGSLSQRLEGGRTLPVPEALTIFRQITEALSYVHSKGIRHCDLKPGNVLINSQGRALIADFGQARLDSHAEPSLGTFFYMPPEQADLKNTVPDTSWDVYSLGAVFYAMVCGGPPREDGTLRRELEQTPGLHHRLRLYAETLQRARPPMAHRRVPGVDRSLARIIDRCLELDPQKRYRNAGEVQQALAERDRWRQKRPLLLVGLVATLLLLLGTFYINRHDAETTLDVTQNMLLENQAKGDMFTAQLAANVVQKELQSRIEAVRRHAGTDAHPSAQNKLVELTKRLRSGDDPAARAELTRLLQTYRTRYHEGMFSGMGVTGADGRMLALDPEPKDPRVFTDNYRYRGWFHGGRDLRDAQGKPLPALDVKPLRAPYYIGRPARSLSDDVPLIPIAAPITDPTDKMVLGVLVAGVPLDGLHQWLTANTATKARVVLIDTDAHCLLHERQLRDRYLPRDRSVEVPTFTTGYGPILNHATPTGYLTTFDDPVAEESFTVGFAPIETTSWKALVESSPQEIQASKERMQYSLWTSRLRGMIVVLALVGGLWACLLWLVRR